MSPSIWDHTSRVEFEKEVLALHKTAPSQRVDIPGQAHHEWPSDEGSYCLPPGTERQLSRDFAFLAAWRESPECVAAATVQQGADEPGLSVHVAANGGIHESVRTSIGNMCDLLMQRANHVITEDTCLEQCLTVVSDFHAQRVQERLGCVESSSPTKRLGGGPVSLSVRLALLIQDIKGRKVPQSSKDREAILKQMSRVLSTMQACECAALDRKAAAVKDLIVASYHLSVDGVSLTDRLSKLGVDPGTLERKEVRHISAFANYYRICLYFTKAVRSHRAVIRHLKVVAVQDYGCERWQGRKHYVHAEIQLLVYHEMNSTLLSPRFVGTSKRACFLCYTFMTAHGRYVVSDTHGEVHPQWTVPDRADYSKQTREFLGQSLVRSAAAITVALQRSECQKRNGPVVQSLIDLSLDRLRTPSVSTFAPSPGGVRPLVLPQDAATLPIAHELEERAANYSMKDVAAALDAGEHRVPGEQSLLLVAGGYVRITKGALNIYLAFEAGTSAYQTASYEVSDVAAGGEHTECVIDIADLTPGEDVTIDVADPETGWPIVLQDVAGNSTELMLRWHEAPL